MTTDAAQNVRPTVDYGRPESAASKWWTKVSAFILERVEGLLVFIGQIGVLITKHRHAGRAIGGALLAGGIGECLDVRGTGSGPFIAACGGFVVGLVWSRDTQ